MEWVRLDRLALPARTVSRDLVSPSEPLWQRSVTFLLRPPTGMPGSLARMVIFGSALLALGSTRESSEALLVPTVLRANLVRPGLLALRGLEALSVTPVLLVLPALRARTGRPALRGLGASTELPVLRDRLAPQALLARPVPRASSAIPDPPELRARTVLLDRPELPVLRVRPVLLVPQAPLAPKALRGRPARV